MQSSSQTTPEKQEAIKVTRSNGDVFLIPFAGDVNEWSMKHARDHEHADSTLEIVDWTVEEISGKSIHYIGQLMANKI